MAKLNNRSAFTSRGRRFHVTHTIDTGKRKYSLRSDGKVVEQLRIDDKLRRPTLCVGATADDFFKLGERYEVKIVDPLFAHRAP